MRYSCKILFPNKNELKELAAKQAGENVEDIVITNIMEFKDNLDYKTFWGEDLDN